MDGEVVVFVNGISNFSELQRHIKTGAGAARYVVFDLIYLKEDLRCLPLWQRKKKLQELLKNAPDNGFYSNHMTDGPEEILQAACLRGLEGIVYKKYDSLYKDGRSGEWIKVKCVNRQEFIVVGYTMKKKQLSSLLLAVNENGQLRYAGKAGTGFTEENTVVLLETFAPLVISEPALNLSRVSGQKYVWLRPEKVAETAFASWTKGGLLRQASFKGLRDDKNAGEVVKEMPTRSKPARSGGAAVLPLTSPGKELYPGVTKRDVMAYYRKIAPRMLPFVQGRLASLVRCPSGTAKDCFYQKHLGETVPGLVEPSITESDGEIAEYLAVEEESGILNAVQLNTIEFHVWGSKLNQLDNTDTIVFDLDPDAGLELKAVRQGLKHLKSLLDAVGLISFVKTSGSKGYHVVIPLNPPVTWDIAREFARGVAQAMEEKWPDRYTSNVRKVKHKGKIFVDWIRNTRGATSVAPYSLRAREVPAVSCPIGWEEIDTVSPQHFTIQNMLRRRKNPWKDYFSVRQSLK